MTGAQIRDWQDWAERRERRRADLLRVSLCETRDGWRLRLLREQLAGKEAA